MSSREGRERAMEEEDDDDDGVEREDGVLISSGPQARLG